MPCNPLPARLWRRSRALVLGVALMPAAGPSCRASETGPERKEPVPAAFQAFFQEVPKTVTPPCRYLCVPGPEGQFPRNLLVDPDGTLFWLAGTDPSVRFLTRAGSPRFATLPGDSRLFALALAAQGWIWMFGERDFGVAQSSTLTRLSLPGAPETAPASPSQALIRFWASPVAAVPEAILALPGGEVVLSLPDRTLRFAVTETGEAGAPVTAGYTHQDVPPAVPAKDRLATANGGWRWTVSRGRQAQAEHLEGKATRTFELPFAAHAAAADPEGNLWFTEGPQGTRIGRLAPDGQPAQVDLGPDLHAMDIVHGVDQAYFTLHQTHWIGALWRARVAPGAGPRRRSLEELNFVFEPYKPRPERPRKVRPRANSGPAPAPARAAPPSSGEQRPDCNGRPPGHLGQPRSRPPRALRRS